MRHGTSLLELLIGLSLLGLLAGIALPRLMNLRDRLTVEQETARFATAFRLARAEALRRSQLVELHVRPDTIELRAITPGGPQIVWQTPGPTAAGVALTGPTPPVVLAPHGLPMGAANGTWTFSRGSMSRKVVISRYGRLRVLP